MRCVVLFGGVTRTQVGLAAGCLCDLIVDWFDVQPGCGDLTSGVPPFSLYCLPTLRAPCVGDYDANGTVNRGDVNVTFALWGPCTGQPCAADGNGDGEVGVLDVTVALDRWGVCPDSPTCLPRPAGMRHYWPGDGNGSDVVGGQDGVVFGSVASTGQRFGAGCFNGTDVWVPTLPSPAFAPFSIELWFRFDAPLPRAPPVRLLRWGGATLNVTELGVTFSGGFAGPVVTSDDLRPFIAAQTWYSVVVTRDDYTMTLFLNGVPGGAVSAPNDVLIGLPHGSVRFSVDGALTDDVVLYNASLRADTVFQTYAQKVRSGLTYC